jgi:hypothetical protein
VHVNKHRIYEVRRRTRVAATLQLFQTNLIWILTKMFCIV